MKKYILIILVLIFLYLVISHQFLEPPKVFYTIEEVRNHLGKYEGIHINIIGYLIRTTNGKVKQDYLLLPHKDYSAINAQGFKRALGLIVSTTKIEQGYELNNRCVNTWVRITGMIGPDQYTDYFGWAAITDIKYDNGKTVPLYITNIEEKTGDSSCDWVLQHQHNQQ